MASTRQLSLGDAAIGDLINVVAGATFTVGAEGSNAINVAVQLVTYTGADLTYAAALNWYLATDSAGLNAAVTAPTGGIVIGTDGSLIESVNNLSGLVISEADGDIDVTLTDVGTPTFYLALVLPGGKLAVSGAITFA